MRHRPSTRGLLAAGAFLALSFAPAEAQLQKITQAQVGPQTDLDGGRLDVPEGEFFRVTDSRTEVANFLPEPFTGLAIDSLNTLWAVNPYASTIVAYTTVTAVPDLTIRTGMNPVSVAVWEDGPTAADFKVIAVCVGNHVAVLHDSQTGDVLDSVLLDSEPGDIVLDPDNDVAYISCRGDNLVAKLDLATFEVVDRYPLDCGERPGYLYLDRGDLGVDDDNRVYVAMGITGNNSINLGPGGGTTGSVLDLDGFAGGELPDEDVFRIDPNLAGAAAVTPVVRGGGSVLFDVERNPWTGELWLLSTDSNNKGPLDTEPALSGKIATNQLKTVSGVSSLSSLIQAGAGTDLDDFLPGNGAEDHDAARSIGQARSMSFLTAASVGLEGFCYIVSPTNDVMLLTDAAGDRVFEFLLPTGAQCYDVLVHPQAESIILCLCLGTMTIEAFTTNPLGQLPFASLPLGHDPTPDQIRAGRDVFLDGQRSKDGRFTCATCHPGGAADQLGWPIRNDPCDQKDIMVTQSLLSIADSFPHHWRGERDLHDFAKGFKGLLGTPDGLSPSGQDLDDFVVFMQSLQAPANPKGNPRRILDSAMSSGPAPNGMNGDPRRGQVWFRNIVNFNGNTCEGCHTFETGGDAAFFEEVGSNAPRAAVLETAHLRQLQHKGLGSTFIDLGGPQPREVNINGFGAAHDGGTHSVFDFIFNTPVFFTLNDQQRVDVFKFVEQFDQGISPACHWGTWFDSTSPPSVETEITEILIEGAGKGWNDLYAIGRFDDQTGGGMRPMQWWYDPAQRAFIPEDGALSPLTFAAMVTETRAGRAEHAFLGCALGNGRRLGIDQDNDGLPNGDEATNTTDPWNPDTDGDGWLDGHEVANGGDPKLASIGSNDTTPPALAGVRFEHATSRVAKYQALFTEDVRYTVEYSTPGGPTRTFTREYFSRADTFVVTHEEPSTPTFPPLTFGASITLEDRAGNFAGPFPLPNFQPSDAGFMLPPFPLNQHVAELEWITEDRVGSTLEAEVRIKMDFNYLAPDFIPAENQMVFCTVSVENSEGFFDQSTDFTTTLETTFDLVAVDPQTGPFVVPYSGEPGPPWVVSPLTDANGETTIDFDVPNLSPGQKVKLSVMGVLFEGTPPQGHVGTVYESISLFQLQPLFLEDSMETTVEF